MWPGPVEVCDCGEVREDGHASETVSSRVESNSGIRRDVHDESLFVGIRRS